MTFCRYVNLSETPRKNILSITCCCLINYCKMLCLETMTIFFFFLSLLILFWVFSLISKQCCDSFRWTAKGLSHTYTCVHSPPKPPPIRAATQHRAESPGLYSRTLLVTHLKRCTVYVPIPSSLTTPSPILPTSNHRLVLKASFWFVSSLASSLFRSHI